VYIYKFSFSVLLGKNRKSGEVVVMSDKKNEQHHHKDHAKDSGEPITEEQIKKEEPQKTEPAGETEPPIDTAEDLRQQLDAQGDRYLRLMAEFDNFKKRVSRDYERLVESANERLMVELIEVRENLERAVKAGEECNEVKTIHEGMKLIFTKFNDVLLKNGLETFGAVGEPFDPKLHNALMKRPNDTVPEDHIIEVFERGYFLKKRVIKHAKVVVSSGTASKKEEAEEEPAEEC
jgi:molecular chaperone GrpE